MRWIGVAHTVDGFDLLKEQTHQTEYCRTHKKYRRDLPGNSLAKRDPSLFASLCLACSCFLFFCLSLSLSLPPSRFISSSKWAGSSASWIFCHSWQVLTGNYGLERFKSKRVQAHCAEAALNHTKSITVSHISITVLAALLNFRNHLTRHCMAPSRSITRSTSGVSWNFLRFLLSVCRISSPHPDCWLGHPATTLVALILVKMVIGDDHNIS